MNKFTLLISFLFTISIFSQVSYADLEDQSGGITNGYGKWGAFNVTKENAIEIAGKGTLTFYHPNIAVAKKATVFFISGWGRLAYTYEKFFYFMASQGYAVVNIYNTNPGNIKQSYQNSLDMIFAAQNRYSDWIDITKIGLMGHSYGAGSTVWLGNNLFNKETNWGENGRFIFMSAPWYSLLVTEEDLLKYPENVKLVIEVGNDDVSNEPQKYTWNTDERAIRAVYELINIPNKDKDFIRVYSDAKTFQYDSDDNGVKETFAYDANHFVSYTGSGHDGYRTWDALDVYAINRISHALMDYVFEGKEAGKKIALGNGSAEQKDMGFLTDLGVTDTPIITRPIDQYKYKCTSNWNDFADNKNVWYLQNGCADSDGDGVIDAKKALAIADELQADFVLYPVPTSDKLQIRFKDKNEKIQLLEIFDSTGKLLYSVKQTMVSEIDISNLHSGIYYIKILTKTKIGTRKFLVI